MNQRIVMIALLAGGMMSSIHSAAGDVAAQGMPVLNEAWRVEQSFQRPESVLYDAARDVLYVSNINGKPTKKDGNGYISRVSSTGDILDAQWVTGLDAPKGMASDGEHLYVSDIDRLVKISLTSGQVVESYLTLDGRFLNDVAIAADGAVYVSDSKRQTIYRLKDERLTVWVDDPRISRPNGIFIQGGQLLVAAGDAEAKKPGRARYMKTIDLNTKAIGVLGNTTPIGSVDGVEHIAQNDYFLTDFRSGDIMHYTAAKGATVLLSPEKGTADIDYVSQQRRLYGPVLRTGKLIAYDVVTP